MRDRIEYYYTDCADGNDYYVDYLEVSHRVKEMRLYVDLEEIATGGCDEDGEYLNEKDMSRTSFYALIDGLQRVGYKLVKTVCDRE